MLKWIEGFEDYSTGAVSYATMLRRYALVNTSDWYAQIVAGRVAGYAIRLYAGNGWIQSGAITADATITVGFAFQPQTLGNYVICDLYDGATRGMNLRLTAAGELAVYRGTTLLETTSGLGLSQLAWYYIEFQVVCNTSTGSYEVRVNTVDVASDSGLDTKEGSNDYHDRFRITAAPDSYFDDLYVCDGSGSLNNDFLGPCRVVQCLPTGDSSVNWSTVYPGSTDHYADVDDGAVSDDDTTYVEDDTTGHRDLFTYANTSVLSTVFGVAINTTCRVTDVNSVDLKTVISSNGTVATSNAETISNTSYSIHSYISETDPETSNGWHLDDLSAALFGIEVG
jgi:hypothetical protein